MCIRDSKEGGIYWNVSGRSYSRQLVQDAEDGKFSDKLVKYMIDTGGFDPQYADRLRGKRVRERAEPPVLKKWLAHRNKLL